MSWLSRVKHLWQRIVRGQRVEEDLDAEVRAHFEILIQRGMARGLSRKEAQRAARLRFGGAEQVKARVREARTGYAIEATLQDIRYAVRMLWRSPGFTLAAVAALALGIGANTAIFSVVNAVLLRPMPYPEPDRLVRFESASRYGTATVGSPAQFQHWRDQSSVAADVAAFISTFVNYAGDGVSEQLRANRVSVDYFHLFGALVARGRTFSAEEDRPGGRPVTVLSHGFWTRRFGSDPRVIGSTISLDGEPHQVIGIIGSRFDVADFGPPPELWIPAQLDPNTNDQGRYLSVVGRLKPGVTLEQAQARLELSTADYRAMFPGALDPDVRFSVEPLREALIGNIRATLLVLAGAVSFVLLIACANVANLLLARATGRRRELAIRAAMGAARRRLMRQLLTESVTLAVMGGVIGVTLGLAGIRLLLAINTADLPRVGEDGTIVGVDWRVLSFTLLVSLGTGLFFGLVPALHASHTDLSTTLKEDSGRSGMGRRQRKARSILVVSEVALALVLLVGSALLIRTAIALRSIDPGFDATNVLTLRMSLNGPRFQSPEAVARMIRDGTDRLRALSGVAEASTTCCVPLERFYGLPFVIPGRPLEEGPYHGQGGWVYASPGSFEVFKIPLKRGRVFSDRDTASSRPVVVINEAMARRFWADDDPLTDRLVIAPGLMKEFADEPERQIIGIVGDVRDTDLHDAPRPMMYIPQAQMTDAATVLFAHMAWVIRTHVPPASLSARIEETIRQASGLPISEVRTMEDVVTRATSRQRFNMWLMTVFGGSALLLAAIGIYGLMAYAVQQRTQEIGIRIALGAETSQVKNMVIVQGMRLAVIGVVIGIASAFGLTRFMTSFLFGVETWDPTVFVMAPLILGAVAFLAAWIPARRASRVDPVIALRADG